MKDETKLDIMLREYGTLRAEILERLKLAYQQIAWAGAVIAFGIPLAASDSNAAPQSWLFWGKIAIALLGASMLIWLSILNWLWLRNCADQLRRIEIQVERHTEGSHLLTWERRSAKFSRGVLLPPREPSTIVSPVPELLKAEVREESQPGQSGVADGPRE